MGVPEPDPARAPAAPPTVSESGEPRMTDDSRQSQEPQSLLGALLAPLRAPQRVVSDIETIASALLSLQRDAHKRLASVDHRAGELVTAVAALRAPLDRVDRKLTELQKLEQAVTVRMDAIRDDLNARMLAVEQEIHGMRRPMEQMTRDLSSVVELLPKASDGPLARLKDTFTAS